MQPQPVDEPRNELPRLLDIESVAVRLGVTVRHLRRLVAERRIPFIKVGHFIRFDVDELNEWLDSARRAVVDSA